MQSPESAVAGKLARECRRQLDASHGAPREWRPWCQIFVPSHHSSRHAADSLEPTRRKVARMGKEVRKRI